MSKHITPGSAAFRSYMGPDVEYEWDRLHRTTKAQWNDVAAAAIHAYLSRTGARGGGKATPAQAAAARRNGYGNRKSKGKPRPPGNAG